MKKFKLYLIIFFLFNFFYFSFAFAQNQNGIDINLDVDTCNNDGICQPGEDFMNCPVDCSGSTGVSGGTIVVNNENMFRFLTVEPSYTSAVIKWNSSVPTIYVLKWGENPDFKNGILKNVHFVNDHSVEITNLKSGVLYYFSIETQTFFGKSTSLENQTFTTLISPDKTPPGNPTNIIASSVLSGVTLSWNNPPDEDFDYIRIMRSTDRFHSDPYTGKLVYESSGQYLRDGDVKEGERYYYTLFARDTSGNFSSGSMVDIVYTIPKEGGGVVTPQTEEPTNLPIATSEILYKVIQGENVKDFELGATIPINGNDSVNMSANFSLEKFADDMWIELRNDRRIIEGKYFFGDKKENNLEREVVIPPIEGNGFYSVYIYRYLDNTPVLIHQGGFDVTSSVQKVVAEAFPWRVIIIAVIILGLLVFLFIWWKRRKKKRKLNAPSPYQGEGWGEVN